MEKKIANLKKIHWDGTINNFPIIKLRKKLLYILFA